MTFFLGFSALCDFNRILFKNIFFQMLPIVVFGLVRLFSQFFQMSPKGPPSFFPIFPKNGCSKTPKCPLLHLLALCDLPRTKKIKKTFEKILIFFFFFPHVGFVEENTCHIEVLLLFLSLRYGADLFPACSHFHFFRNKTQKRWDTISKIRIKRNIFESPTTF